MKRNPNTFGPDGASLDAMRETCRMVRVSLHEAIDRGDYRQVRPLIACLTALERAHAQLDRTLDARLDRRGCPIVPLGECE